MKEAALALILTLFSTVAYADGYAAIAAGAEGSGYVEDYDSTEGARQGAVELCRKRWHTSCSVTTAGPSSWYYVAGLCDGEPYTAASADSWNAAKQVLLKKGGADGRISCRIFANH